MSEKYRCTKCGCLWRMNHPSEVQPDGSWSLYDVEQKSCKDCDNSPEFLSVIEPVESAYDTPRTDAVKFPSEVLLPASEKHLGYSVRETVKILVEHARQLEREANENAAAKEALDGLIKHIGLEFSDGYCFERFDEARRALHNIKQRIEALRKKT